MVGTSKLRDLYERFEEELGRRQEQAKAARPKWEPPKTKLDEDPGGWSCTVWAVCCFLSCFFFNFIEMQNSDNCYHDELSVNILYLVLCDVWLYFICLLVKRVQIPLIAILLDKVKMF